MSYNFITICFNILYFNNYLYFEHTQIKLPNRYIQTLFQIS